ncbi:hypothetical protein OC845_003003 [Tilletia horrida]|nr:hypothetical protein OC845_003003 [Tilletia horrida]
MAIFSGLRSKRGGRRESIFGNSDEQPTNPKANNYATSPHSANATDVLGDSPSFASRTTRPPSESTSLRNRTSSSNMLRLFGSGKRSASTSHHDGPPHSATSSSKGEKRNVSSSASDAGHRTSRAASHSTARPGNNGHAGGGVFSQNNGSTAESLSSAPAAPRPSDLFAGKGVNWDELKLAGGSVSTSDTKRTDELQNYLKARRQWIPTFKTDSSAADGDKPPANLEEVSFGGAPAAPAGLMTLKDLEASHDRKQRLLSDLPISSGFNAGAGPASPIAGGSTSGSSSKPALVSRPSQSSSIRGVPDLQPARNQSFRQSPFVGGALTQSGSNSQIKNNTTTATTNTSSTLQRTVSPTGSTTLGSPLRSDKAPLSPTRKPAPSAASALLDAGKTNGNGNATTTPTKSVDTVSAPPRKSSVAGPLMNGAGTQDSGSSGATVTPSAAGLAVPALGEAGGEASTLASTATSDVAATAPSSASARVRPSMDSTTGFATPEARSEAAHAEQTPRAG